MAQSLSVWGEPIGEARLEVVTEVGKVRGSGEKFGLESTVIVLSVVSKAVGMTEFIIIGVAVDVPDDGAAGPVERPRTGDTADSGLVMVHVGMTFAVGPGFWTCRERRIFLVGPAAMFAKRAGWFWSGFSRVSEAIGLVLVL